MSQCRQVGIWRGTECHRRTDATNYMFVQQIGQIFSVWYEAAWAQNRALRNTAVYRKIRRLPGSINECSGPVGQVRLERRRRGHASCGPDGNWSKSWMARMVAIGGDE